VLPLIWCNKYAVNPFAPLPIWQLGWHVNTHTHIHTGPRHTAAPQSSAVRSNKIPGSPQLTSHHQQLHKDSIHSRAAHFSYPQASPPYNSSRCSSSSSSSSRSSKNNQQVLLGKSTGQRARGLCMGSVTLGRPFLRICRLQPCLDLQHPGRPPHK